VRRVVACILKRVKSWLRGTARPKKRPRNDPFPSVECLLPRSALSDVLYYMCLQFGMIVIIVNRVARTCLENGFFAWPVLALLSKSLYYWFAVGEGTLPLHHLIA
jgi:hypothetical protein